MNKNKEYEIVLKISDFTPTSFKGHLTTKGFETEEEVNRYLMWWIMKSQHRKDEIENKKNEPESKWSKFCNFIYNKLK